MTSDGPNPPAEQFVGALRAEVRDVLLERAVLEAAATDRSGADSRELPRAVVRPRTVADVQTTVRIAARYGVAVVPRGAGSGLAGGATADGDSVVVDLGSLDRILDLDPDEGVAVVEPGVVTADLDRVAAVHGLRYAPDPASSSISTIGGNIATNAGGMRCVKYGVTRDSVLGLQVVLADGRLVRTGRATAKGVAGLDLTSLFVGSEGTLGIVVEATVRLRPRPERTLTCAAAFADLAAAAHACVEVTRAHREPAMLELLDAATLRVIDEAHRSSYAERGDALVIAQADGTGAQEEISAIGEVLAKEATHCEVGLDTEASDRLVAARRLALPSIETLGRALIEDVCVPRLHLADAFAGVAEIARKHDVRIYCFAHAGDGNLHPIIGYDADAATPPAEVIAAGDAIFALALELGGTVTGEHGIGALKRRWLAQELGPVALDLHHRIKAALDPAGVLNPGKGF